MEDKSKVAMALGLTGLGAGTVALIASLTKPVKAATGEPQLVIVDGDIRNALATLILGQEALKQTISDGLKEVVQALSSVNGPPPVGIPNRILEPFQKDNQTLQSGTAFSIYESKPGQGSLIWTVIDVSDPNTVVTFKFDDLTWEFAYNDLRNQGIDQPLFPGVWLSRYDPLGPHYTMIFSAGTIGGFGYNSRLQVLATFRGAGNATLTQGRGIKWTYL